MAEAVTPADRTEPDTAPPLPTAARERLQAVRRVRDLRYAEAVLADYQRSVLADKSSSAGLSMARDMLRNTEGNDDDAAGEQTLRDLVDARPDWAEAWLELGTLLLDSGRDDDAITALQQALAATPLFGTGDGPHPHAVAARKLARVFSRLGRDEDAARYYALSLTALPGQAELRPGYGEALRRLGQTDAAAQEFTRALIEA